MTIRFLFFGDVVGMAAHNTLISRIPQWRKEWNLDCVVVNAENTMRGRGLTPTICQELYAAGVDCITTGNHIWDQREIIPHIEKDDRLLRPVNFSGDVPGRGHVILATPAGKKIMIVNVMLRLFMHDMLDDPFSAMQRLLGSYKLGRDVDSIIVDVHGESTSEKMAMAHLCDGRASVVVGTHTHIPTADYQILERGTAYQTDAGMCGCYDSVIGFKKDIAVKRFQNKVPKPFNEAYDDGEVTLAGLYVEIDEKTGLASRVEQVISGGKLRQSLPSADIAKKDETCVA